MQGPCRYCGRLRKEDPFPKGAGWFCLPCVLRSWFPYFTSLHGRILFWFYLAFAGLTLLIVTPGAVSGHGEPFGASLWGVILAFTGPFTGMASRGFYAGYRTPGILPYCSAALLVAFLCQLLPLPLGSFERPVRLFAWCAGLLGWFAGTIISTLEANS